MNPATTTSFPSLRVARIDRLGVAASVLCAIHCAAAPILLLAAPVFGRTWAHPASHWIVALLVVPLAGFSLFHGWRRTSSWVKWVGSLGIAAILMGAALPYFEAAPAIAETGCADACCPSIVTDSAGASTLVIPAASMVTTLGGLFLISAHIGNLRACRSCANGCCSV